MEDIKRVFPARGRSKADETEILKQNSMPPINHPNCFMVKIQVAFWNLFGYADKGRILKWYESNSRSCSR